MRATENQHGKVIDMTGRRSETSYRAVSEVEAYWQALRAKCHVPKRSDIDPRGIENALEYAFILEKIAPGQARLRIAGMHLSDLMGMEVRGMPVSSFIPPAGRRAFSELLDQVMSAPATARIHLRGEDGIGKPPLDGQMILLPLENDFGEISRVLGCFETHGPLGRAPRRFNITGTELRPLALPGSAPHEARLRDNPQTQMRQQQGFGEPLPGSRTRRAGRRRARTICAWSSLTSEGCRGTAYRSSAAWNQGPPAHRAGPPLARLAG
ncbi:PAS domain-containing protein [Aquicoccus sp. G2-2]|uniref:PAS domain-containing protein n=1 Tax=Aquicoccus sp. G2-2 TaxID=3092120 RepID=UPI002ADF38BE|nr:PAS domain-containing protein [Aquicoccus sp. G2-2]MEA1113132.1 PAS domain-containing protein [Aquicoccus sp. G2-2]